MMHRSRTHAEKEPAQYLLTVEQMTENDCPIHSYLADVFQKSEGWIETPQVAAGAEGSHTVYAIDCEMVHILMPCHSLKITIHFFPVHDKRRQGANPGLCN